MQVPSSRQRNWPSGQCPLGGATERFSFPEKDKSEGNGREMRGKRERRKNGKNEQRMFAEKKIIIYIWPNPPH